LAISLSLLRPPTKTPTLAIRRIRFSPLRVGGSARARAPQASRCSCCSTNLNPNPNPNPTGKSLQLLQHAPSAESRHGRAPYEREEAEEEEEEEEEEPLLYHEFLRLLAACSGAATRTAGEAEAEVTLTNPLQVNSRTHVPIQLDKGILRSCLLYH
jgi:hypothetical protein